LQGLENTDALSHLPCIGSHLTTLQGFHRFSTLVAQMVSREQNKILSVEKIKVKKPNWCTWK